MKFRNPRMVFFPVVILVACPFLQAEVKIDADYPGGNIILDRIEGDTVLIRQDLRDTQGWWFYWNFRVCGAGGKKIKFAFAGPDQIGTRGPAVSIDGGKNWKYMGTAGVRAGKCASFAYTFPADCGEVRFAFAIPYQVADLQRFIEKHKSAGRLKVSELCKSRGGRTVPRLDLGRTDGKAKNLLLFTCRTHCCESTASYVLEGILETILAEGETGKWFRQNIEVLALPFMDVDGVEKGDQGKNRKPRDHNRDFDGRSNYPSVSALRKLLPDIINDRRTLVIDLHCPWIRGSHNELIYMVGSSDKKIWTQQQKFGAILESIVKDPLSYRVANNLEFGKAWNTEKNYRAGKSASRWAGELKGVVLSTTVEIPYANVGKTTVTADLARAFGADLAKSIRKYLE